MRKFVVTTALALVLAGGAYAQGHHGGGGGGGGGHGGGPGGGGGGGPAMMSHGGGGGGGGPSMMSRGPSGGPSGHSSFNGPSSQFSRNSQGPQGRTLYNQGPGNQHGQYSRLDRAQGHNLYNRSGGDHDMDFRHRGGDHNNVGVEHNNFRHGIARGDFFEHGRHFHFRRFWHGEWVFLTGFDDCTAWAWVNVAPGVWAWSPVDVCIG